MFMVYEDRHEDQHGDEHEDKHEDQHGDKEIQTMPESSGKRAHMVATSVWPAQRCSLR